NATDFVVQNTPTPQNSQENTNNIINGSVVLTITPDTIPVQNITPFSAQIVFQVNSTSTAKINYGLSSAYGSSTAISAVPANTLSSIALGDLQCNRTYHYSIYAENSGAAGTDQTTDKTFSTIPCNSIILNSLTMPKTAARADNNYLDGWEWQFNITIWNMTETSLKMKFDRWTGTSTLDAANNMQFSVDNGLSWSNITANGVYPVAGVNISGIDNSTDPGRQVKIIVQMKVPVGTLAGTYNSNYGILTQ
ncbi:MAG: hypothetical protein NTW06_04345, partial [Candidatus Falkowbacteria bacterium]|nr:hypothetical protein [Candidatus Falkowbacteria bacterium]